MKKAFKVLVPKWNSFQTYNFYDKIIRKTFVNMLKTLTIYKCPTRSVFY